MESNTLWMGAIQPTWTESFLKSLFKQEVQEQVSVKLFKNNLGPYDPFQVPFAPAHRRNTPIGYAFIEFRSHEAAKEAKEKLQNQPIKDTNIVYRLNWAVRDKKKVNRQQEQAEHSLFVGDLSEEVTDEILEAAFREKFVSCTSANVVIDPTTGHSKKYGFVRFSEVEDYLKAMESMNGMIIGQRAIRIGQATAKQSEANLSPLLQLQNRFKAINLSQVPSQTHNFFDNNSMRSFSPPMQGMNTYSNSSSSSSTVFVGNLDSKVTEEDLREHFQDCGEIVNIKIPQYKKGCGFIIFSKPEEAQRAISTKEKTRLGESKIRLDWGREKRKTVDPSGMNPMMMQSNHPQPVNMLNMQDMNTLKYMSSVQGVPTFAYNYNYIGYVTKPTTPSYGYYNFAQQQQQQQQRTSPISPVNMNPQDPQMNLSMGYNAANLQQNNMQVPYNNFPTREQSVSQSPNGSPTSGNLNFGFNSLNFGVQ